MASNLIISNGYYTSCLANSILQMEGSNTQSQENYMISYYKQSKEMAKQQLDLTKLAFKVKAVLYQTYFNQNRFNLERLLSDLKINSFDNILIPINSSTLRWASRLKKHFSKASFFFYEEGLISYIKPVFDCKLRNLLKNHKCFYSNYSPYLSCFLKENLKFSDKVLNFIEPHNISQSWDAIKQYSKVDLLNLNLFKHKNALFLPQYYHENNPKKCQTKIIAYQQIIEGLMNKGYQVLIKPHPKANKSDTDLLKPDNKQGKVYILNELSNLPVEPFLSDLNLKLVFSVYSTSLLTSSNKINNIPAFTCYDMLKSRINSLSLYPSTSCYLIKKLFPNINDFIKSDEGEANISYENFSTNKTNSIKNLNRYSLLLNFLFKCYK